MLTSNPFTTKNMQRMLKFLYLILFTSLQFVVFSQKDWVFKNERNNVKVYYKKTTEVYELKMTSSVKSSADGVLKLLSEIDNFPNWIYSVKYAKVLQRISETEVIYYILLDFPWPLNDRDMIMHSKLDFDDVNHVIYSRSYAKPNFLPVNKDIVRISHANLEWKIFRSHTDFVYFEYTNHTDPAGKIPDWLINLVLEKGPMESIRKMKTFVERDDYVKARLKYLK
jgi:START domain